VSSATESETTEWARRLLSNSPAVELDSRLPVLAPLSEVKTDPSYRRAQVPASAALLRTLRRRVPLYRVAGRCQASIIGHRNMVRPLFTRSRVADGDLGSKKRTKLRARAKIQDRSNASESRDMALTRGMRLLGDVGASKIRQGAHDGRSGESGDSARGDLIRVPINRIAIPSRIDSRPLILHPYRMKRRGMAKSGDDQ
jgi:hypothetical protein